MYILHLPPIWKKKTLTFQTEFWLLILTFKRASSDNEFQTSVAQCFSDLMCLRLGEMGRDGQFLSQTENGGIRGMNMN